MKQILTLLPFFLIVQFSICTASTRRYRSQSIFSHSQSDSPSRAGFGEPCDNNGTKCDARANLACMDDLCQCTFPDKMAFNNESRKCLVLSGQRCSYNTDISGDGRRYTETLDCVPNAICKRDGFCECRSSDYYEDFNGYCVLRKSFGENCTEDKECREETYLACDKQSGTCTCHSTEAVFDSGRRKCAGLARSSCINSYDCVQNATCDSNHFCTCRNEDYYENSKGFCVLRKGYGETCTAHAECQIKDLLGCHEGSCKCLEGNATFNSERSRCVGFVGSTCSRSEQCVGNAQCKDTGYRTGRYIYACVCDGGFTPSAEGLCLGGEDAKCKELFPCHHELDCVEGKCGCPYRYHQSFNSTTKKCESRLNGPCLETMNGKEKRFDCATDNSECRNISGLFECVCKDGYIVGESWNGPKCYVAHGNSCGEKKDCDYASGQICSNGKCTCPNLQLYEGDEKNCRGLVGATCSPRNVQFCIDGAYCKVNRYANKDVKPESMYGLCRCKEGYHPTSDRKCIEVETDKKIIE